MNSIRSSSSILMIVGVLTVLMAPTLIQSQTITFSFDDTKPDGPSHWPKLFSGCNIAGLQSPIDVVTTNRFEMTPVFLKYSLPYQTSISLTVQWAPGTLLISNMKPLGANVVSEISPDHWTLYECEYFMPSIHTINGVQYPLERVCKFDVTNREEKALKGETEFVLGRVSHFFQEGAVDDDTMLADVAELYTKNPVASALTATQEMSVIRLSTGVFITYPGTSAIPPCSPAHWILRQNIESLRTETMTAIRKILLGGNGTIVAGSKTPRRPIQPSGGRPINVRRFFRLSD